MGLGQGIAVNLDKYFTGLEVFAGKENVQKLKEKLGQYGIQGTVTVYSGPQEKDGEVLIPYTLSSNDGAEGIKGLLRFKDTGILYEGFSGNNQVGTVEPVVARLFLGGLYGANEVSAIPDQKELIYQGALLAAKGCWIEGSTDKCDMGQLEATRNRTIQAEIDAIQNLIEDMIKWAKAEDGGPGGIDPDDITDVVAKYNMISFVDDRNKKQELLRQLVNDILDTYTAQKYAGAHGATCETSSTDAHCSGAGRFCGPNRHVECDDDAGTTTYSCDIVFPGLSVPFHYSWTDRDTCSCTCEDD